MKLSSFYMSLLGSPDPNCIEGVISELWSIFSSHLLVDFHALLLQDITDEEIFRTNNPMPHNKSPGSDGYT